MLKGDEKMQKSVLDLLMGLVVVEEEEAAAGDDDGDVVAWPKPSRDSDSAT